MTTTTLSPLDKAKRVSGDLLDLNQEGYIDRLATVYDRIRIEVGHDPSDDEIAEYVTQAWREARFTSTSQGSAPLSIRDADPTTQGAYP